MNADDFEDAERYVAKYSYKLCVRESAMHTNYSVNCLDRLYCSEIILPYD